MAGEPSTRRPPEEAGKAEDELSRGDGAEMVEEEEVRESHCGDDGLSPSGSGFNLPKYQVRLLRRFEPQGMRFTNFHY